MSDDQNDIGSPAFARTGFVSPMGTLLDELKTKVDPETALEFRRMVHDAGMDASGALRDWVYSVVHGKTYTDICMDAAKVKRQKLFGTGPIGGLVGNKQ